MIVDFKQYSQLTEYVPLLPDIPKSADANRLSFVKGGILGFWTLKSLGRITSHTFWKEPEGCSEKILKYVKCAYIRISLPRRDRKK